MLLIKLQRNGEYHTWHFSQLCCTICWRFEWLTEVSPFIQKNIKSTFLYICAFLFEAFFGLKDSLENILKSLILSLSVLVGLCSICFISVNPSVPKKYTAVHQCTQSRHASNDFSYPYLSPPLLLLILRRYNINTGLWQGVNSCIKVHKRNYLKIINTDCETQEFTSEYMFTQITPELQTKYFS